MRSRAENPHTRQYRDMRPIGQINTIQADCKSIMTMTLFTNSGITAVVIRHFQIWGSSAMAFFKMRDIPLLNKVLKIHLVPVWRRRFMTHRLRPMYSDFGFDRGWPVDRYYIEGFLAANQADIRGEVLEAGAEPNYTLQFGGDRVTGSHVLLPPPGGPGATLIGNLETGEGVPENAFDCAILTQVFQFIYDMPAAARNCHAMLKDGGVLLVTFSGISQVETGYTWEEYWRVTAAAARRLFADAFGPENVTVEAHGNILTACALLHGLVISDLKKSELDFQDPEYQVVVTVRAVKRNRAA